MPAPRTIHFVSLGCPKNRVDAEVMLGIARESGFAHVADASAAEVIVVSTCGFIGEAKKESIDAILEMASHKDSGACRRLVVTGCLSQRHPDELAREMPEVDHFLGSSDMPKLRDVLRGRAPRVLVGNPAEWLVRAADPRTLSTPGASAYVKIAEGCDRTCSFCVIPELRGRQRSRPIEDVVREVEQLAAGGVREVNLVSQDSVAYGRDLSTSRRVPREARAPDGRATLTELVRRVADVRGVHWVRLFYLYPETLDDGLVELLAHHPRVVPYVDMPLQHAADAMLRRMRRGHGGARLRSLVTKLKTEVPELTFRTAFIVGHPGETEQEFEELCELVRWAEFDRMGVFRYSDEEDARSHGLRGKVPPRVSESRYRRLMAIQRRIAHRKNAALVGRELEVLVSGPSDEHEHVLMGRHAGQAPDIDGSVYLSGGLARPGELRTVQISQAADYDLVGELLDDPEAPGPGDAAVAPAAPATRAAGPAPRVHLRVLQTDGRTCHPS